MVFSNSGLGYIKKRFNLYYVVRRIYHSGEDYYSITTFDCYDKARTHFNMSVLDVYYALEQFGLYNQETIKQVFKDLK